MSPSYVSLQPRNLQFNRLWEHLPSFHPQAVLVKEIINIAIPLPSPGHCVVGSDPFGLIDISLFSHELEQHVVWCLQDLQRWPLSSQGGCLGSTELFQLIRVVRFLVGLVGAGKTSLSGILTVGGLETSVAATIAGLNLVSYHELVLSPLVGRWSKSASLKKLSGMWLKVASFSDVLLKYLAEGMAFPPPSVRIILNSSQMVMAHPPPPGISGWLQH